ncbi:MAG: hypothetical protein ACPG6B_07675 [Oceanihabitans sp.]
MPINQFPYDGTISGSDLSALFLGSNLGNAISITIHRDVTLSWDIIPGKTTISTGKNADKCWEIATTNYSVIWKANVVESVTKVTKPVPVINKAGKGISDLGKVVVGIGTTLLTWAGISAASPLAPTAPVTATGSGIVIGVGGIITGAGELVAWLTDGSKTSWTTSYTESGTKTFNHAVYKEIECKPDTDYPDIDIPNPIPTLNLLTSESVSDIGNDLASSGNIHPPKKK